MVDRGETGLYHVLAASSLADERTRVLKQGDTFAVFDHYGDIKPGGLGEEGLYHEGTRYLSCLLLELEGSRPFFLSSTVRDENDQLAVALTNPDLFRDGRVWAPLGTLHIALKKFLWQGVCYQQLRVKNHGLGPVEVSLTLHFAADYADIYEVRGIKRKARGEDLRPEVTDDRVVLGYRGLDGVVRRTLLQFAPPPSLFTASTARLDLSLQPQQEAIFYVTVGCERQPETATATRVRRRPHRSRDRLGAVQCLVLPPPFLEWADQRLGEPGGVRPAHDDDRAGHWTVPLRWPALVQHPLRARRDHHRAGVSVAPARPRAGRVGVPGFDPGHGGHPRAGCRARQDLARDPHRRDGRAEGDALWPLLRQRGRHAAVRPAGRRVL